MKKFLKQTIKANRKIHAFIKKTSFEKLTTKKSVGYGGDTSLLIDLKAEKIFIKKLKKFGQIYSEEKGLSGKKSDFKIIIDPIDGSSNFISKVPYFGTSVALLKNEKPIVSVICNLANEELFIKNKFGFFKSNLYSKTLKKIQANRFSEVGIFEKAYKSQKFAKRLKKENIKYRSLGAIALSLANANNVDFVLCEGKIRDFDIAAGWHMCEDLYRLKNNNFLLVSKDKNIFAKMSRKILKRKRSKEWIF